MDNWWDSSSPLAQGVCRIPGATQTWPYGTFPWQVCGGAAALYVRPLQDSSGTQWGSYYLHRDFNNRLWITVTLDGSPTQQPFLEFNIVTPAAINLSISSMLDYTYPAA